MYIDYSFAKVITILGLSKIKAENVHRRDGSFCVLGLKLEKGMTVAVNLDFSARSYPDKNGEIRFENQVRITNIAPFSV